jgi:hypothetical protein
MTSFVTNRVEPLVMLPHLVYSTDGMFMFENIWSDSFFFIVMKWAGSCFQFSVNDVFRAVAGSESLVSVLQEMKLGVTMDAVYRV